MKHFKLLKGVLACLLSLALAFGCVSYVGIKADTTPAADTSTTVTAPTAVSATFVWSTNSVKASSAAYVYVLKAKTGNAIKKGAKSVQLAKAANSSDYTATMTELGVKVGKKDVYLYVCDKEFETDGTNISANLEIKAPEAKKVTGTVDYTKADGTKDTFNVLSATAVDNAKKAINDPEIWWSTEAEGTYFEVNDSTESATRVFSDTKTKAPNGFDGRTLNEMLAAGGGTIYIKMAGKDGASGTAQFGSKAIKVKIAKQAAAPKIKLDAKKDTLAIKNGFDFGYAKKESDGSYTVLKWFTVLPNLKTAAVKTSDASIVATTSFTPLNKKDTNAGKEVTSTSGSETTKTYSFTAYKFKAVSINSILGAFETESDTEGSPMEGLYSTGDDCIIAVRKSATEKKPASAAAYLELSAQSDSPIVYTQDNVKGQYLVATATDFEKKGFSIGTIVPYPGSVSGENVTDHHIATIGYDDTFEVGKAGSGETIVGADANGSTFEYAIVATKDLTAAGEKAIDWTTVSWKKLDAKTKITSKLKGKYSLLDGTKTTVQLGTESAQAVASDSGETAYQKYSTVKTFLVVRRTGASKSSVRASNLIYLYVAKEGKNYNLYSTVDNGDEAFKYTVKFLKYQKGTNDTYTWDLASDVEDISVWVAKDDKKYLALPSDTSYDLYETDNNSGSGATTVVIGSGSGTAVESVSGGTNKGKYEITGSGAEYTKYIAVREKANVKIVAEITTPGESTKKEETLITIKNGKSSISGDTTVYYVGSEFSIPSGSGATVSSVSGYTLGDATSVSGGVTVSGTNFTGKVDTAEETTLKVAYTRALGSYTLTKEVVTGATVDNETGVSEDKVTYKTNYTFKVSVSAEEKEVDKVSYKVGTGSYVVIEANAEGVYTISGDKILDVVSIKVELKDKPSEG